MYKCNNENCPKTKEYLKYQWKCDECGQFWTLEEFKEVKLRWNKKTESDLIIKKELKGFKIGDTLKSKDFKDFERIQSTDSWLNNFFWWGIVKWSINLISWVPWVWKSTFLLDIAKFLPKSKILYISWEENIYQITSRAQRMSMNGDFNFENVTLHDEKLLENILQIVDNEKPDIMIIDSLQVLETINMDWEIWWLKQQKYITRKLVEKIKKDNISTFLVWHVTSDWSIAWAMFVEHMVDSVIKIEPATERWDSLKIMKNLKNRFSWSEILCYNLLDSWIEIISTEKLAELFISESSLDHKWTIISAVQTWNQLFLVEIQSLVTEKEYSFPERIINNYNKDKFKILLKIIWENVYRDIYKTDVATNILSPLRMNPSDIDLAMILSIISHINWFVLWKKVVIWQVWFNWEIKSIPRQADIIRKLKNLWFKDNEIISSETFKNIWEIAKKYIVKNK